MNTNSPTPVVIAEYLQSEPLGTFQPAYIAAILHVHVDAVLEAMETVNIVPVGRGWYAVASHQEQS
jgi:hypothetical protein